MRLTFRLRYCSEVRRFIDAPRPGAWHDPDMLVVGNTPCPGSKGMGCGTFTPAEEATVMSLWCVHPAPSTHSHALLWRQHERLGAHNQLLLAFITPVDNTFETRDASTLMAAHTKRCTSCRHWDGTGLFGQLRFSCQTISRLSRPRRKDCYKTKGSWRSIKTYLVGWGRGSL